MRVRFDSKNQRFCAIPATISTDNASSRSRRDSRSRAGCKQCKQRRVKCDETFPTCLRCWRRNEVCMPASRPCKWHDEVPWLSAFRDAPSGMELGEGVDKRLIRYWIECASPIMVVDPDINPLSFPILRHLSSSPSLRYALQSIGASHEHFFSANSPRTDELELRSRALSSLRNEIKRGGAATHTTLLTVFLLGISTSWVDGSLNDFGQAHLLATRVILDRLYVQPHLVETQLVDFVMGSYIYWYSACSFLLEPSQSEYLVSPRMLAAVQRLSQAYHAICGHSLKTFYLLGIIGRYCRAIVDGSPGDPALETLMEHEMLHQRSVDLEYGSTMARVDGVFRKHGLVMLYRHTKCQRPYQILGRNEGPDTGSYLNSKEVEETTKQYAWDICVSVTQAPSSAWSNVYYALPLVSAGSELGAEDITMRQNVIEALQKVYSMNRVPANLLAIQLLSELWELRDAGFDVSWLELMVSKGWRLMLG